MRGPGVRKSRPNFATPSAEELSKRCVTRPHPTCEVCTHTLIRPITSLCALRRLATRCLMLAPSDARVVSRQLVINEASFWSEQVPAEKVPASVESCCEGFVDLLFSEWTAVAIIFLLYATLYAVYRFH